MIGSDCLTLDKIGAGGLSAGVDISVAVSEECKASIIVCSDFVTDLPVQTDAAGVGHKYSRLTLDVGAEVPGPPFGVEGGVGHLIDVFYPGIFGSFVGLKQVESLILHMPKAIRNPVNMLFNRDQHIAQY